MDPILELVRRWAQLHRMYAWIGAKQPVLDTWSHANQRNRNQTVMSCRPEHCALIKMKSIMIQYHSYRMERKYYHLSVCLRVVCTTSEFSMSCSMIPMWTNGSNKPTVKIAFEIITRPWPYWICKLSIVSRSRVRLNLPIEEIKCILFYSAWKLDKILNSLCSHYIAATPLVESIADDIGKNTARHIWWCHKEERSGGSAGALCNEVSRLLQATSIANVAALAIAEDIVHPPHKSCQWIRSAKQVTAYVQNALVAVIQEIKFLLLGDGTRDKMGNKILYWRASM